MNKIKFLGAIVGSLLSLATFASDQPLKLGIEAAYPPFASKTPDGNIVGFDYDIGNALCEEMQVKCVWIEQEFDGLIPALKVRKIDTVVSSLLITDERKKIVDFTDKYYQSPAQLMMKSGTTVSESLVELNGKTIGVLRGSMYNRFANDVLKPLGADVRLYASQNEIFLELASGRLDGTLAHTIFLQEAFLDNPEGQGYAFVGPVMMDPKYFGYGVGIAVRKGERVLLEKLNAAIQAIRTNGKYKAIQEKYFKFDIYGG